MVSIIVPVYNVEKYVGQCIQSIVNQTYSDLEILLLDDGSTDSSGEICREWQRRDPRIIYVVKRNEGQGTIRNLGVRMARGEILSFVDSDDWLELDFIEVMLAAMGDCDMVFCDYSLVKSDQTLVGRRFCKLDRPCTLAQNPLLLYTMGASTGNKLYRREWWIKTKVIQPAYAYEDTSAMPGLWAQANQIAQVQRPLYNYRIDRPESTTNISPKLDDMYRAIEEVIKTFSQSGLREHYRLYLEKYCAMALSIPISRMKDDVAGQRQAHECFYHLFPDARKIDKLPVLLLGGLHGQYTLSKACFLRDEFVRVDWTQDWVQPLQTTDAQLILMDFSSDVLPDPKTLGEILRQVSPQVCLLAGQWSESYGLYGAEQPFAQIDTIRNHNRVAADCCSVLQAYLPHASWLECNEFDFTDSEFIYGCEPQYKNHYFYYSIAEQLWALFRSLL